MSDRELIQQLVQQELNSFQGGVNGQNMHHHTGQDSLKVNYDDLDNLPSSGGVFGGKVNSDGTAGSPFPTGWTSSDLGSSYYEITHNLGTTNYSIALTIYASVGFIILGAGDVAANTFRVRTFDTSSASSDRAFYFLLTLTS